MKSEAKELLCRLRSGLSKWRSESLFTAMPVPGVVSPLASLNNGLDALKGLRLTSPIVKKSALTACQQARQACRHVDIAVGSTTTTSWPTRQGYSSHYTLPAPTPRPANIYDLLDKDQILALMASQQTRDVGEVAADINAAAMAARASRSAQALEVRSAT